MTFPTTSWKASGCSRSFLSIFAATMFISPKLLSGILQCCKNLAHPGRCPDDFSFAVQKRMNRQTLHEDPFPLFVPDLVGKFHAGAPKILDPGLDKDDIVIPCRVEVVALKLCQRQEESFLLH